MKIQERKAVLQQSKSQFWLEQSRDYLACGAMGLGVSFSIADAMAF